MEEAVLATEAGRGGIEGWVEMLNERDVGGGGAFDFVVIRPDGFGVMLPGVDVAGERRVFIGVPASGEKSFSPFPVRVSCASGAGSGN